MSHYDVLGVVPAADAATVRQAYVALARQHHPDRPGGDAARMRAINDAWAVLGDPIRRAQYDRALATPEPAPAPPETQVQVRRTGGLAGQRRARTVALAELSDDDARGWSALLAEHRLQELAAAAPTRPVPDAFVYHVACPPDGEEVTLPEHGIPEPVRDLIQRTLGA